MPRTPRSVDLTQVSEWDDGKLRRKDDYLAAEEPLEIRIGERPAQRHHAHPRPRSRTGRRLPLHRRLDPAPRTNPQTGNRRAARRHQSRQRDRSRTRARRRSRLRKNEAPLFRRLQLRHLRQSLDRFHPLAPARRAQPRFSPRSRKSLVPPARRAARFAGRLPAHRRPARRRPLRLATENCWSCAKISAVTMPWTK